MADWDEVPVYRAPGTSDAVWQMIGIIQPRNGVWPKDTPSRVLGVQEESHAEEDPPREEPEADDEAASG